MTLHKKISCEPVQANEVDTSFLCTQRHPHDRITTGPRGICVDQVRNPVDLLNRGYDVKARYDEQMTLLTEL